MPLDLSGFVAPVDNYSGLYKIGDDLEKQQTRKDVDNKVAAQQNFITQKAITDLSDPKEFLSGTPMDPHMVQDVGDVANKAYELYRNGADHNTVTMAIAKDLNDLHKKSETAKVIKEGITQRLQSFPSGSGYDKSQLTQSALKSAWYNTDGTLKTWDQIDPNIDYVAKAIQDNPQDIATNEGFDNWMKNQRLQTSKSKIKITNENKGSEIKQMDLQNYEWQVPNTNELGVSDRTLVPRYEIAHDGQKPIMHTFIDAKGNKVEAPVRLLHPETYNSLLTSENGHSIADFLRGQINIAIKSGDYKDAAGNPIKSNSPQAEQVGRAIAYDELKVRGGGSMSETVEQKANPIKNTTNVYVGKGADDIDNVFARLDKSESDNNSTYSKSGYPRPPLLMNSVDGRDREVLLKQANEQGKRIPNNNEGDDKFTFGNTYIYRDGNGLAVYQTDEDGKVNPQLKYRVMPITERSVNVRSQVDAKRKQAAIEHANKTPRVLHTVDPKDPLGIYK